MSYRAVTFSTTLSHITIPIFYVLRLSSYLWNGWSQSRQLLHTGRLCQVLALGWQTTP